MGNVTDSKCIPSLATTGAGGRIALLLLMSFPRVLGGEWRVFKGGLGLGKLLQIDTNCIKCGYVAMDCGVT